MTIFLVSYCLKPECAKSLQSYPTLQSYLLVAHKAPLPTGFSRQEYRNGLPFPTPGVFPTQGSNPSLLHCREVLYHLSYQQSPNRKTKKPQTSNI